MTAGGVEIKQWGSYDVFVGWLKLTFGSIYLKKPTANRGA
jgi:hypothetical protein